MAAPGTVREWHAARPTLGMAVLMWLSLTLFCGGCLSAAFMAERLSPPETSKGPVSPLAIGLLFAGISAFWAVLVFGTHAGSVAVIRLTPDALELKRRGSRTQRILRSEIRGIFRGALSPRRKDEQCHPIAVATARGPELVAWESNFDVAPNALRFALIDELGSVGAPALDGLEASLAEAERHRDDGGYTWLIRRSPLDKAITAISLLVVAGLAILGTQWRELAEWFIDHCVDDWAWWVLTAGAGLGAFAVVMLLFDIAFIFFGRRTALRASSEGIELVSKGLRVRREFLPVADLQGVDCFYDERHRFIGPRILFRSPRGRRRYYRLPRVHGVKPEVLFAAFVSLYGYAIEDSGPRPNAWAGEIERERGEAVDTGRDARVTEIT